MPSPITCVGYVRVSTESQADEVRTSLADQEAAIRVLASRLGVAVGRWFRDAGASGATVDGRPAFVELLAWCEANRRGAAARGLVLVLNDSRFGRFPEPEEATYWRHHLHRLGWVVRFCEADDVEGDFRTVVRAIGSVQASEYRRNLVANTRRGMKGAADQGFWTREAPYGYRRRVVHPPGAERVLEPGQRKADNEKVKLVPHEPEARIALEMFQRYAAGGESLGSLAAWLDGRAPGRQWCRQTVRALLRNDAYRGAVVGGRRRAGGSELYGLEDAHEPIVPTELWAAVERRLGLNADRGVGVRSHYLLSGILCCSYCGEAYTGGGGGVSRTKAPERSHRRFYRDSGGVSGTCPGRIGTIMRHLVDPAAVDLIASTLQEPAVQRRIEREIDDALDRQAGSVPAQAAELRARRNALERQRQRLQEAVAEGAFLPSEVAAQAERIRGELVEVEGRLQALRFTARRAGGARAERDQLLSMVLDFRSMADRLAGPHLRELVAMWLGRATFDKVGRVLSLGIRRIPAVPALALSTSPAPG